MTSLFIANRNFMPEKTKYCQPGYLYQATPGLGMTATMDTAPILAMNILHVKSTQNKSRINFLKLLTTGNKGYIINDRPSGRAPYIPDLKEGVLRRFG